jgi:hypothetical protein
MLRRVELDPNRFEESVAVPTRVAKGEEARRTERELLPDEEVIL